MPSERSLEHFAHEVRCGVEQGETHLCSPYPQALRADGQGHRAAHPSSGVAAIDVW